VSRILLLSLRLLLFGLLVRRWAIEERSSAEADPTLTLLWQSLALPLPLLSPLLPPSPLPLLRSFQILPSAQSAFIHPI
jgi:hypothetical protein